MGKYFQKRVRPDIINGDVSTVIQSNKTDLPFSEGDILFDWTAVDVPLGTDAVVDMAVHSYGEDGGTQPGGDFTILIAKSNSGAAPTTLGSVNSAMDGCYELPDVLLGQCKMEGNTSGAGNLDLGNNGGTIWRWNLGSANGAVGPVVIEPEHNALGGTTTNRIYIAAICGIDGSGRFDFSTGVKPTAQVTTSSGTIAVDGVDPRKAFRVGDQVYTNTEDTPCGTIASMTSNQIVLNANTAVQIEDNEELVNAKPMTIVLGLRGR